MPFGLCLEVLSHYVTYVWGPGLYYQGLYRACAGLLLAEFAPGMVLWSPNPEMKWGLDGHLGNRPYCGEVSDSRFATSVDREPIQEGRIIVTLGPVQAGLRE